MEADSKRKSQAKLIRIFRKIHRATGAFLFFFFFIIAISGLLLGWKKHSGGLILADTYQGSSKNLADWLPIDQLQKKAGDILQREAGPHLSLKLDRIDIRPDNGTAKFVFAEGYWGIQLDGATGNLLHLERRRSDLIENIHDGSILDRYLETSSGQIKLLYTSLMGLALLTFTITGFWLWIGPKRMKRARYS